MAAHRRSSPECCQSAIGPTAAGLLQHKLLDKDDVGGAMIGYVQSVEVATISSEVSEALAGTELPPLPTPSLHPGSPTVHVAEHDIERLGAASPFTPRHFWVDLRKPT